MLNENQGGDVAMEEDGEQLENALDFEEVKGKLSMWVQRTEVVRWIRKIFTSFLRTFRDENNVHVYEQRVHEMCQNNK